MSLPGPAEPLATEPNTRTFEARGRPPPGRSRSCGRAGPRRWEARGLCRQLGLSSQPPWSDAAGVVSAIGYGRTQGARSGRRRRQPGSYCVQLGAPRSDRSYTCGVTKLTIEVDDHVAEQVAKAAAARGVAPEQLAADAVAERFGSPRRRLAFAAIGASGASSGAAQADELLAEGFGRGGEC